MNSTLVSSRHPLWLLRLSGPRSWNTPGCRPENARFRHRVQVTLWFRGRPQPFPRRISRAPRPVPCSARASICTGYDLVGRIVAVGKGYPRLVSEPKWPQRSKLVAGRVTCWSRFGIWSPFPSASPPCRRRPYCLAWQMLFREADAKAGQTILVHGANGVVGTVLHHLGRHFGIRVIGTSSPRHHDASRAMSVEPVDYSASDLAERILAPAPGGVDGIFDHLGLESVRISCGLLHRGVSLILCGNAAAFSQKASMARVFLRPYGTVAALEVAPQRSLCHFL